MLHQELQSALAESNQSFIVRIPDDRVIIPAEHVRRFVKNVYSVLALGLLGYCFENLSLLWNLLIFQLWWHEYME